MFACLLKSSLLNAGIVCVALLLHVTWIEIVAGHTRFPFWKTPYLVGVVVAYWIWIALVRYLAIIVERCVSSK
jgi:hypothetical protein